MRLTAIAAGLALFLVAPAVASAEPHFEATAAMTTPRENAVAAPLPQGKVLIAGGFHYLAPPDHEGAALTGAEVFDSTTGEFTATGSMAVRRMNAVAAPLPDGDVLVAGGHNKEGGPWASAEVYDHVSGEFSPTGSMAVPRWGASAAVLPDGRILVAGGANSFGTGGLLSSAEIYDPESGEFSPTGSMAVGRRVAAAAVLPDGKVIVAGGVGTGGLLSSAEIYDPESGEFSPTGSLPAAMTGAGATLSDGTVLVFGDLGYQGFELPWEREIEEYDPVSGTFSTSPLASPAISYFAVAPLPDGTLLLAGGSTGGGNFAAIKAEGLIYTSEPSESPGAPAVTDSPEAEGSVAAPTPASAEPPAAPAPTSTSTPPAATRSKPVCKRAGHGKRSAARQPRCGKNAAKGRRSAARRSAP